MDVSHRSALKSAVVLWYYLSCLRHNLGEHAFVGSHNVKCKTSSSLCPLDLLIQSIRSNLTTDQNQ